MAHASDVLPVMQSGTTEAQDLSDLSRHLEMDYAVLRWSARPFILYGTIGPRTRDGLEIAAIAAGGRGGIARATVGDRHRQPEQSVGVGHADGRRA